MIKDHAIYYMNEFVMNLDEIKIVGKHNVQNMMIAIIACALSHVALKDIHDTLASFMGVEHRIEFVRELNHVKYYNDSKGTNTDATIISLKAFEKPVILLMDGFEKGLDLSELSTYQDKISTLICFGDAKEMKCPHTLIVENMKDTIIKAKEIAKQGDVVLLSPSTSSFDEFSGYEERGRFFKDNVHKLKINKKLYFESVDRFCRK